MNENTHMPDDGYSLNESIAKSKIDAVQTEYTQLGKAIAKPYVRNSEAVEPNPSFGDRQRYQEEARKRFLSRYEKAIKSFLGCMMKNPSHVEAVWEQFVDKWLQGKLDSYDPAKGHFRKFLKQVLRNAVYNYWKALARNEQNEITLELEPVAESAANTNFDIDFRNQILQRSITSVGKEDSLYFEVLSLLTNAANRGEKPPNSDTLSKWLTVKTGTHISRDNARQIKKRAKEQFAKQIINQVRNLIGVEDLGRTESELADLQLLPYCKNALAKMKSI